MGGGGRVRSKNNLCKSLKSKNEKIKKPLFTILVMYINMLMGYFLQVCVCVCARVGLL